MESWELMAPCHFGLEAVLKREILDLGYEISRVEDGRVCFWGDARAVADGNVFLRTAERILIKVGSIHAESFDELFEETKKLPWEDYIPKDGKFWVAKANSVKSKLFSPSDIQSIMKKAIVDRLQQAYKIRWFPEDGAAYPLRVSILKDQVFIGLDTTGVSLHKRGYRKMTVKAPLSETLAAALILLTPWKQDRILVDPFCGSGTFPIEAAMIATNQAPGARRSFQAQQWKNLIAETCWQDAREEAQDLVDRQIAVDIQGYDLDAEAISYARENARLAGVDSLIHFQQRPVRELNHPKKYGFLIANPPYGERLDSQDLRELYREIGQAYDRLDSWSMYLITSYEQAEKAIGKKANKNRKIYNGMMKTYFYQYFGPAPHGKKGKRLMEREDAALEKLLRFYEPCFDIKKPFAVGETHYDAYAFCDVTSSKYVLVEKAELWRAYTFEHVFFRNIEAFTQEKLQAYERQLRETIEPTFVRRGQKYPIPDHMCTYLTGIFICCQAVSKEHIRAIRRHRFHKNYRFALRGYCESRLVVWDLETGQIYGNVAAKPLVKSLKQRRKKD